MSVNEIGKKLVALCQQGKNMEAIETLYDQNVVSVEAMSAPGMDQTIKGLDAVLGKNKWWSQNHEVHSGEAAGPFPHGDRFAVMFNYDVTNKPSGRRMQMQEMGLYTVKDDKIVKEEFFYCMDGCPES